MSETPNVIKHISQAKGQIERIHDFYNSQITITVRIVKNVVQLKIAMETHKRNLLEFETVFILSLHVAFFFLKKKKMDRFKSISQMCHKMPF